MSPIDSNTKLVTSTTIATHVQGLPVKDKANPEIVKWHSKKLRKPNSQVRIVAGTSWKTKSVEIIGMDWSFLNVIGQSATVDA